MLLHLGIYAFRRSFLAEFVAWPQTSAERSEKLEQLRVLEHDRPIYVQRVRRASHGIDTAQQYADFVKRFAAATSGGGKNCAEDGAGR
jgi:3-deoxy-manno-octulosonate cytidylyltransferase (CMP-KDO synthetase)